jgi:hypothetical protein
MKVIKKCKECGKKFDLGLVGVWCDDGSRRGAYVCDDCAGIERDADGNAWMPEQTLITWEDGTVTTREEAFSK